MISPWPPSHPWVAGVTRTKENADPKLNAMWEIDNQTALVSDRTIVIDKNGDRHWVVVIKGTFDIMTDGTTEPAEDQAEVRILPQYRGDDGESSLRYEQDLIAGKPGTDVYVNASAHAPHGRPTARVAVEMRMPGATKVLTVTGDRQWQQSPGGRILSTEPQPFVTMPIIYERAYGGYDRQDPDESKHRLDPQNPVGTGFFTSARHRHGRMLPNIEWPGRAPSGSGPAGLGALCSFWEPRTHYQGTYGGNWAMTRKPLLPVDFDPRWLMCAPADQQTRTHLRGDEPFELLNMTPAGLLAFALPKHAFRLTTFIGRKQHEHTAKVNTVIIEPEYPRVVIVWHSTLSCHHEIDDIDRTRVREKPYV